MEREMMGNYHVSCGVGEKLEITSNAYLLLTILKLISAHFSFKGHYLE